MMEASKNKMSIPGLLLTALAYVMTNAATAEITFEDTSVATGLFDKGTESWGASWGDFNGDGRPDLFVPNHRQRPALFQNNGDGTFTDVSLDIDVDDGWTRTANPLQDNHGAAFADVDNDGDQDLFISGNVEWFYENVGGNLRFRPSEFGFNISEGGSAAFFDYNNDNFIDLKISHGRQPGIWQQRSNGTFFHNGTAGMQCSGGNPAYTQIADLDDQGLMEAYCVDQQMPLGGIAHHMRTNQDFLRVTGMPTVTPVRDSVFADFNGDLLPDLLAVKGTMRPTDAVQVNSNRVEAQISVTNVHEKGVKLMTGGVITVSMDWNAGGVNQIFIGASGYQPAMEDSFTLDPNEMLNGVPINHGIRFRDDSNGRIMSIGYDPATGVWEFALRARNSWQYTYLSVDSTEVISIVSVDGLVTGDLPYRPSYLLNSTGGLLANSSTAAGFEPELCVSVAAGDYDNDMDIDVFLACRGGSFNIENVLYENLGDGSFVKVAAAGGAGGVTGPARGANADGAGTSDSVAIADYDGDGYLDVFVTGGLNMRPLYYGGPLQMFRNTGSGNNWLQFDLAGVMSNRDGVGAKIRVTTPDGTTQLREQNGGYHRWSQNFARIHVGLAQNATADVEIEWPSGTVDTFTDVTPNIVYVANEGGALEPKEYKLVKPYKCDAPAIDVSTDKSMFVWKRCFSGIWTVRTTSFDTETIYEGGIFVSSGQVMNVLEDVGSIEAADVLTDTPVQVDFALKTGPGGFDSFTLETEDVDTAACLDFRSSERVQILVGGERRKYRVPFDLNTLEPCSGLPNLAGPVIGAIADQDDDRNAGVSLQISATDADGDWPVYSATGLPPGLDIDQDSGQISGSSSAVGSYTVTVSADDGRGENDSQSFNWTIADPTPPPQPKTGGGGNAFWLFLLMLSIAGYRRAQLRSWRSAGRDRR